MKSPVWTKSYESRRCFIGGSDARIIMGSDEAALIWALVSGLTILTRMIAYAMIHSILDYMRHESHRVANVIIDRGGRDETAGVDIF